MAISKVVLVGAGGNLGRFILQALLDAKFEVTILSRKSSKSTFTQEARVVTIADDYPYEALLETFKGQDAVVAPVAGPAIAAQKQMIDAAAAAGVQRFIPGEYGSHPHGEEADNPIFQSKKSIIAQLESKKAQGLSWTGICNGALFEFGIETGFLHISVPERKASVLGTGDGRYPTSTYKTSADATVGVLRNPEATANRRVFVQSYWISPNELIRSIEKATDSKFEVTKLERKPFVAEAKAKIANGDKLGIYDFIWSVAADEDDWNARLDNKVLGVPEEQPLDEVVAKVVKGLSK